MATNSGAQLIVIASIHQPSTSTFELFDQLVLLSSGRVCYNGPLPEVWPYFESMGAAIPTHTNPAEFLLDLTSSDFAQGNDDAQERILKLQVNWQGSPEAVDIAVAASTTVTEKDRPGSLLGLSTSRSTFIAVVVALLHRSFIKSYRDVVVYGIRLAMYIGMSAP